MTRIKICGITNAEDAKAAVAYGADALGFIAVPDSPRYVNSQAQFEIWDMFQSKSCTRTGPPLFVAPVIVVRRPDEAEDYAALYVQFYEDPPGGTLGGISGIRAFRVRDADSVSEIECWLASDLSAAAILLDTYHRDRLGGSGETFNWELAVAVKQLTDKPIILAGGLTPENVAEAVATVRPYAVDVSSGVEAEPGRKDHDKLRRFIRAVRQADRALED